MTGKTREIKGEAAERNRGERINEKAEGATRRGQRQGVKENKKGRKQGNREEPRRGQRERGESERREINLLVY